uniref:LacI family transcriptional regulator n=1 Tax=Thermus tengchongensis TaxID=1214928 RepID=A0A7V4ANI8_9DEIN
MEIARSLGYTPDQVARSLKRGKSRTLGLILSDISVSFHADVARGVEEVAQAQGYSLILFHSQESPERERAGLELLKSYRVAGIILEPTGKNRELEEALVQEGIRVVEVDRISGAKGVPSVLSDNLQGAALAAEHLLQAGHRWAFVVGGELGLTSCGERTEAFARRFTAGGGAAEVYTCPSTPEGGYEAALRYLSRGQRPSAVFVTTGQMAQGVLQAFQEQGIAIPQEVSLVVFDDPPWASLVSPPLTAVRQQAQEIGRKAAQRVLGERFPGRPKILRLPTELVERASVARLADPGGSYPPDNPA